MRRESFRGRNCAWRAAEKVGTEQERGNSGGNARCGEAAQSTFEYVHNEAEFLLSLLARIEGEVDSTAPTGIASAWKGATNGRPPHLANNERDMGHPCSWGCTTMKCVYGPAAIGWSTRRLPDPEVWVPRFVGVHHDDRRSGGVGYPGSCVHHDDRRSGGMGYPGSCVHHDDRRSGGMGTQVREGAPR